MFELSGGKKSKVLAFPGAASGLERSRSGSFFSLAADTIATEAQAKAGRVESPAAGTVRLWRPGNPQLQARGAVWQLRRASAS